MAINLVRKPSETPNINNFDDYRLLRYATGGGNGIVKDFANECDYEINGSNFKIKSGEIIIDGVQARVDAGGITIVAENITGTEYYTIYCEINLTLIDNQKTEIKATKSTVDYPVIEKGDDLTENQTGIARLELYRFKVNGGVISNVQKSVNILEYSNTKFAEIEDRLTDLGFKYGFIRPVFANGTFGTVIGNIYKQGNYVIGVIDECEITTGATNLHSGNLLIETDFNVNDFLPNETVETITSGKSIGEITMGGNVEFYGELKLKIFSKEEYDQIAIKAIDFATPSYITWFFYQTSIKCQKFIFGYEV